MTQGLRTSPGATVHGASPQDGDLDLVLAFQDRTWMFSNDGSGRFRDDSGVLLAPSRSATPSWTRSAVLADLDGDSDLDLVLGKGMLYGSCPLACPDGRRYDEIFTNLARQLVEPLRWPMVGQRYELSVYSGSPASRSVDVALTYVSVGRAQVPIPGLGVLGIDPNSMIALAPVLVPQPAGVATVALQIPNAAQLAGQEFFAQAIVLRQPGPARLTNVTQDRILR